MASRFGAGGRLLATGELSDVRHVTVEFVHPVIVGKRALPALGVTDGMELIAEPHDMVIGFGPQAGPAVAVARERGCLILDLAPVHEDPFVQQELHETLYHVLWELVHVFLEHDAEPIYAFLK